MLNILCFAFLKRPPNRFVLQSRDRKNEGHSILALYLSHDSHGLLTYKVETLKITDVYTTIYQPTMPCTT